MNKKLTVAVIVLLAMLNNFQAPAQSQTLAQDSAQPQAQEINMLFMGNSFTFRHDLPELVKQVFEEGQRGLTMHVEKVVYGGQDLFRHHDLYRSDTMVRLNSITVAEVEQRIDHISSLIEMETAPDFFTAYWKKAGLKPMKWAKLKGILTNARKKQRALIKRIEAHKRVKWDYLVLQSWRDVGSNVDAGYAEYAQKWARIAEQEGIKVILYITAPHAQNAAPVTAPLNPEKTEMEMKTIHQLVDRINPYAVVPVAIGIKKVQQNGTDLRFRYVNDMHPNQTSAFLASNMFYAAFFKKSTEGFMYNTVVETNPKGKGKGKDPDGDDAQVVFDDDTKILLQKAAHDAVVEFYSGSDK